MKKIALSLLFLSPLCVIAQSSYIGLKAAYSTTWVAASPNQYGHEYGVSKMAAGLTYTHFFKSGLSYGAELLLEGRGFGNDAAVASGNNRYSDHQIFRYNYLSLPLKFGYASKGHAYLFGNAGLVPAFLLSAKVSQSTIAGGQYVTNSGTPSFDMAWLLEAGAGFRIEKRLMITLGLRYQKSFTNAMGTYDVPINDAYINHQSFNMSFGLAYKLKDSKVAVVAK